MLTDCPDPKEVADFHFLQLRTLKIARENESIPEKSVNILASASKYGLLFIGVEKGLKVIKLEDILTVDEDKENRSIEENYSSTFVPSETPVLLAVNASQTTLAVCVKSASGIIINLYNLSSFLGSDAIWQPFSSNTLSPPGIELRDFVWNPAVESLYTFCLSDGSLHIHEMSGMGIKPVARLPTANAISVCWSPKGKQLVVGKQNGSFTQYKPTLEEVKTVMPPALEDSPVSATSICWISNTVYAVVYVANDSPYLFIVSTPKGAETVYANFNDVCLGNNSIPDQRYLLHLEPSWGILICASLDSIEVAVLGDMPNWVQWDLKEDGKALLPGKDGATHAVGMSVIYSAQRQIIISESESYPPMPVMFLLTNNGLLVSFHMINAKSEAPSLVSPPLPLESKTSVENGLQAMDPSLMMKSQSGTSLSQPAVSSTFVLGKNALGQQAPVPATQIVTAGVVANTTFSITGGQKETSNLSGNETFVKSSNKPEPVLLNSTVESQDKSQLKIKSLLSTADKQNEVLSSTENSYMTAIISEIQSFIKELQDLKQLQSSAPTINGEDDMSSLNIFAVNLHNFQKDITETMQSLSTDIYTLKNALLESFVMVEEANSRERRRNDHSYITMLKDRVLDPITAKRMQKMNQHDQYLSTQLQELSNRLDQDWIHLISNKNKSLRNNACISSTEAIYKTIVNNQKTIHNMRRNIDILMKKAEERKLRNTTKSGSWLKYHKKSAHEDLSKLADEFLQVKIASPEEGEPVVTKKLSQESQNFLKAFLKQSNVVTVRPTTVYSPSQSRLLSNVIPSDNASGHDQEQNISPKQVSTPSSKREMLEKSSPAAETVISNVSSKLPISKESDPNETVIQSYAPVYEPITPPHVTMAPLPMNKTFTSSTPLMKETHSKYLTNQQSIATVGKDSVDQGVSSSILSGEPSFSFSTGVKLPTVTQSSSETMPSAPASLIFSKTLSFSSNIQRNSENATSKPLTFTVNSSSTVSSSSSSSGFQFGQKKDTLWSTPNIASSTASSTLMPELRSSITMEKTQLAQQEVNLQSLPSTVFSTLPNQSFTFTLPVTRISQISAPLSAAPENKTSHLAGDKTHSDASQTKNAVGFFLQKPSDNIEQSVKKDATIANIPSNENSSFPLNLASKTVSFDSKPLNNQEHTEIQKLTSDTSAYSSAPINNTVLDTVEIAESLVIANSQPDSNSVAGLSDLKLAVSSSSVLIPKPFKASSSVPVTESVVSNASQITATANTNVVSVVSQSDPIISKPPSPSLPTLSTQTTTAPTSLFGPNVSVSSSDTSDTKKSESAIAPSFGMKSLFGQLGTSETPSVFSATKTDAPVLAQTVQPVKTDAPVFTQPVKTDVPAFGQPAKTDVPAFGQPAKTEAPIFGQTTQPAKTDAPVFGQTPQPAKTDAPVFGQTTQGSLFGQSTTTSSFLSGSGVFFSQTPAFGAPAAATATTSTSDFNNQSSTFSFGKPTFGQTSGSFGLAKSVFGQNTTSFTQSGPSSTSFSFGQSPNSVFAQGSFFSGLGGKPSEEKAATNVFGISNAIKSTDTSNLFRNSSVTSFGAVNTGSSFSGTGSFSGGSGSVAQSGFGSFQQASPQPQQPGGFGGAPTFGSPPAFGSPPTFGGSPGFGSGNSLSAFGQQQLSSNFSNFANASSPTFGSLASQSPGFGSPGFGTQGNAFGSPGFGNTSFDQQQNQQPLYQQQNQQPLCQSSSFGSLGSPPSNSSAFTQWRN